MKEVAIARELEAMAQTGLHFAEDPYDRDRYTRLREIASEMLADTSNRTPREVYEWSKSEFFDVDNLPELSKCRVLEHQIRALFDSVKSGNRIAIYD